jgi:hypothetical protein
MIEYNYNQGDIVAYSLDTPVGALEGTGRIVGVAVNHIPIMGCIYMVEDPENFPNSVYPYTTIPMQESALEFLYHLDDEYHVTTWFPKRWPQTAEIGDVTNCGNDYKAAKKLLLERSKNSEAIHQTVRVLITSNAEVPI